MRRPLLVLGLVGALIAPAPAAGAAVPVLVIDGKGYGHGVGMAQDGALAMGRAGSTTAQILNQFYPGTTLGRAGGELRVSVLTSPADNVVVRFPNGGEVRDARDGAQSPGFPVRVAAGGQARLRSDGRLFVVETAAGGSAAPAAGGGGGGQVAAAAPGGGGGQVAAAAGHALAGPPGPTGRFTTAAAQEPPTTAPATTTTTAPGLALLPPGQPLLPLPAVPILPVPTVPLLTTTTAPAAASAPPTTVAGRATSTRSLWAVPAGGGTIDLPERSARYRGVVQTVGGGPLRLVNHVDVEQYLRGMGEVRDPSWPAASLRAQAVAARTYAMRALAGGGELCDTQRCQVYLGAQAEYAAMDKAVTATRGQVLMYRKSLVSAVYSANGGGFSASTEEGFGTPGAGYPYLRPAAYLSPDPDPWTVTVSLRDVAARVGLRGKVTNVVTRTGPSGRVVQVTVEGTGGARSVSGLDFDRTLGLRSTLFTVRLAESASAPPPPPTDGGPVQGLPGDPAGAPPDLAAAPAAAADPATAAALPAAVAAAADPPTPASKVALGALAWLLLMAASGGLAFGRAPVRRRRQTPD